jgi:hypothetical protein
MIRRKTFPTPSSYLAKDEVLKVTAAHCRTTLGPWLMANSNSHTVLLPGVKQNYLTVEWNETSFKNGPVYYPTSINSITLRCHRWVDSTPVLYLGGPTFKYTMKDVCGFSVFSANCWNNASNQTMTISPPHPMYFLIHYSPQNSKLRSMTAALNGPQVHYKVTLVRSFFQQHKNELSA